MIFVEFNVIVELCISDQKKTLRICYFHVNSYFGFILASTPVGFV